MNAHSELHIAGLEERLRQAMLASNVADLDTLIAPELLFTSHLGQLVGKQRDLDMHRARTLKLTELTPSDQRIHCHSEFSIVSVQMHLVGSYEDNLVDEQIRYTRVWAVSSAGLLQIVAGHASVVG
ncbi:MAG: DUF4440 domain-containing protein [Phormidesmis priestleyi]|uniref:DUF4440 domain-containing protein n=1 Tax=Phormidesmis priestleyi TaxID=268141 RepID=A0A2W4WMG0_9CYAN|nr:MAG: DUF4440 domain-containing protein [Phormidesmis priestleyi]